MALTWHLERREDPGGWTDAEILELSALVAASHPRIWATLQPTAQLAHIAVAGGHPPPTVLSPEPLRAEGGF